MTVRKREPTVSDRVDLRRLATLARVITAATVKREAALAERADIWTRLADVFTEAQVGEASGVSPAAVTLGKRRRTRT